MEAIGVAQLTALELAPVRFIRAAGAAGFAAVGLRLAPAHPGGVAYPTRPATTEHRVLRDLTESEGVAVRDIEFAP
jgi:hypothetical protein